MRELVGHRSSVPTDINNQVRIRERAPGVYQIGATPDSEEDSTGDAYTTLTFHEGPTHVEGVLTGVTDEALLAIVLERLRQQEVALPAGHRDITATTYAIQGLSAALRWLQHRTRDRARQGAL